jgi:hypothetical protein
MLHTFKISHSLWGAAWEKHDSQLHEAYVRACIAMCCRLAMSFKSNKLIWLQAQCVTNGSCEALTYMRHPLKGSFLPLPLCNETPLYSPEIVCIFLGCYGCCLSHIFRPTLLTVLAHDFIRCLLNAPYLWGKKASTWAPFSHRSYTLDGEMSKRSHVYTFYLWVASSINCIAAKLVFKSA